MGKPVAKILPKVINGIRYYAYSYSDDSVFTQIDLDNFKYCEYYLFSNNHKPDDFRYSVYISKDRSCDIDIQVESHELFYFLDIKLSGKAPRSVYFENDGYVYRGISIWDSTMIEYIPRLDGAKLAEVHNPELYDRYDIMPYIESEFNRRFPDLLNKTTG